MTNPVFRIRFLYFAAIVISLIFIYRLFSIQIVNADYYVAKGDRQYQQATSEVTDRGAIYFTTKNGERVPAAVLENGFLLAIDPRLIKDPGTVYNALQNIIALDAADFFSKASKTNDPYEEIARKLSAETAEKIKKLNLPGVTVYKERWRVYPAGKTAAHVLGFLGYGLNGHRLSGRYGLEAFYDKILERDGEAGFFKFLASTFAEIRGPNSLNSSGASGGEADLLLTIEPTVQNLAESELTSVRERFQAEAGGVIIMNPLNGEIRAMAAWPNFDPNERGTDLKVFSNPLTENIFEFGSVVKPLTIAAGLDAGVIDPETTYVDPGIIVLNQKPIQNYDRQSHGTATMQEVLNKSLNTGAVFIMQKLGQEKFQKYFSGFGLEQKTGIDLPNEANGLTKNLHSHYEVDYATASFGQGIAVTPINLTRALAALANGGKLIKPHLVKTFKWRNSRTATDVQPEIQGQAIKPETSEEITKMLIKTVDTALAGGKAKMANYTVAAKTGTAQIAGAAGYDQDRFLHAFFGYFPASQPRFLVFLYLINPRGVRYASESLTDPFLNITKFLLNYYEIPPDRANAAS